MNWTEFRERLTGTLDGQELRTLCFDLGVDYDSLRGEAKAGKIRELIALLRREGRLPELTARLREIRPRTSWPDLASHPPGRDAPPDSGGGPFPAPVARPGRLVVGSVGLGLAGVVLIALLIVAGGFGVPRAGVNATRPTAAPAHRLRSPTR